MLVNHLLMLQDSWEKQIKGKEIHFFLMVSVNGPQAPSLLACGEAEHHGGRI
jgi:hypothetical protein